MIKIVSPAGIVSSKEIAQLQLLISKWGLCSQLSEHCIGNINRYSGTMENRIRDFKDALHDDNIRAIFCSAGGYGSVQLLEHIINDIQKFPKWIIGFSDITAIHAACISANIQSIHASMSKYMISPTANLYAEKCLCDILYGKNIAYKYKGTPLDKRGKADGILIGGNLSTLSHLIGTKYDMFRARQDIVLFIEDINEPLYKIERMLYGLKYSGLLSSLKGLIVGRFINCKYDGRNYFDANHLILDMVKDYHYPVCFDFPIGHIEENLPMIEGSNVSFVVEDNVYLHIADEK